jgi:hypothetical protein
MIMVGALLRSLQSYPASLRAFLYRNRRKVFFLFAVASIVFYVSRKLKTKAATRTLEFQQLSNIRIQTYFESAQRACDATTLSFVGQLREKIDLLIEMPSSTQIRNCNNKEQKIVLWEELKTRTFSRTFIGVYSLVLLALHLRLQVNIVGRYLHLDTVLSGTTPQGDPAFGSDTQKRYLAHAEYLLQSGMLAITPVVERVTEDVLRIWPLTRIVGYDDTLRIILDIRNRIEGCMDTLLTSLLPGESQDTQQNDLKLVMLLSETRNILESEAFHRVMKQCFDNTFLRLTNNLRISFETPAPTIEQGGALCTPFLKPSPQTPSLTDMPMAKFIPIVNKQFSFVLDSGSNEILNSLSTMSQLQEYSLDLFRLSR